MRSFSVFTLLVGFVAAVPSPRAGYVLHEKRTHEPVDWMKTRRLEADRVLPMRFGLAQSNLHKLEEMLMAVSHPKSPSYGKHYSPEDVVEAFKPSDDTIDAVTDWLIGSGISADRLRLSVNKAWIEVDATAAEAEDLLNTEYHTYTHHTGVEQIGCENYRVPKHIQQHIDLVRPTIQFHHRPPAPSMSKRDITSTIFRGPKTTGEKVTISHSLSNCSNAITPACLQALYNIDYKPVATEKNTFGIVEFTPQAYLQPDLDMFFKNFSPNLVGQSPKLISIDGGVAQTSKQSFNDNGESDLDLEYAMTLVQPQQVLLLQTGDSKEGGSYNNWLDAVDKSYCTYEGGDVPIQDGIYPDPLPGGYKGPESCGIIPPPYVVSTSYGSDEIDVSIKYANRQCYEYGKIGMMGSTVLYSSGDDGVASGTDRCLGPLGIPTKNGTQFVPSFPVDCPWVTAVGATQIDPGKTVYDPEGACEQVIYSGGGFSNYFSMPSYQSEAVESFLKNHPPPYSSKQYNNSGKARAYPDLSANGANYVVAIDGQFIPVFGTSCSSPVVGSIITMINDARLAAHKGPVGFINPSIYSSEFAHAFNDITHGTNPGCGTVGFTATKGWDPVTGVGTPNFEALKSLWLSLP